MNSKYEWETADSYNPWGKKRKRGSHCSKGHEFTEENTFYRAYDGARVCRECRKQYAREKYQRNKTKPGAKSRKFKNTVIIEYESNLSSEAKYAWYILQKELDNVDPKCYNKSEEYADNTDGIDDVKAAIMCAGCPALELCYNYAKLAKVNQGIWGGKNFTEEDLPDVQQHTN
jgi:hypothetical protein